MVIDTAGRSDVVATVRPPGRSRRLVGVLVAVLGLALLGAGGFAGYRAFVEGRAPAAAGATPSPTTQPTRATATAGPTATATPTPPLVAAAPALAARPETAEVVRLLATYFGAINTRDFETARGTLVQRPTLASTEAQFLDQYRSTHDQNVRVLGLTPDGSGGYLASVTFTSYQNPADAPDRASSCLIWTVSYPLVRAEGTLLIDVVGGSNFINRPC